MTHPPPIPPSTQKPDNPNSFLEQPISTNNHNIDKGDGSRMIEVITMLGDSVIDVRHLSDPSTGKIRPLTWCMLILGWGAFFAGVVFLLAEALGVAMMALLSGLSLGLLGAIQARGERRSPDYSIGESPKADLHTANPIVPTPCFPLVQSSGTDFMVNIAQGMDGEMKLNDKQYSIQDLITTGEAHHAIQLPNTFSCQIPHRSQFALTFGDNTFLIRSVDPIQSVAGTFLARVDLSSQPFNGLSLAVHTLFLALVFSMPPDARGADRIQDLRTVKIEAPSIDKEQDNTPLWLEKLTKEEAGPAGKRHKGLEGKMGSKRSPKTNKRFAIKGPKENQNVHLARELALEEAQKAGLLGIIKTRRGGHLSSIFGRDSIYGRDVENALGSLVGNENGENYGTGGLGVTNTGRGGGGDGEGTVGACTGPACYGKIGLGLRHGKGTDIDRWKKGLKEHKARAPRVTPDKVKVVGGLDKELIRRTIRRHINEVRYCYQRELQGNPDLRGRVVVKFSIANTGRVQFSHVKLSTVSNNKVGTCISQAVRRWTFPKPNGKGVVIVTYPFLLHTAG